MGRDFVWHGPAVMKMIEAEVEQKLDAAAIVVTNKAKKSFTGPKHGTFYKGQKTRSSKPGEPPAVQTSVLAGSPTEQATSERGVGWEKSGALERRVGTNVKYGRHLEFGTKNIAARPWLLPALVKSKKALKRIFS